MIDAILKFISSVQTALAAPQPDETVRMVGARRHVIVREPVKATAPLARPAQNLPPMSRVANGRITGVTASEAASLRRVYDGPVGASAGDTPPTDTLATVTHLWQWAAAKGRTVPAETDQARIADMNRRSEGMQQNQQARMQ